MNREVWVELIREANSTFLSTDPVIEILKRELEDDELIRELNLIDNPPNGEPRLSYSPFYVEFLIDEVADLINNCIQKRTELKNLEVTLLTTSINDILSKKKSEFDKTILGFEEKNKEVSRNVISKQTKLVKDQAGNLNAELSSSNDVGLIEAEILQERYNLKEQVDRYQAILFEFSRDPNSGLNYLIRYKQSKEIYWLDFKELFRKIKALHNGLNIIYGIIDPLPNITKDEFLDKLYTWFKFASYKLSKILERDQEITVLLNLGQAFQFKTSAVHMFNPTGEELKEAIKVGRINVDIEADLFDRYVGNSNKARLRSVSVIVKKIEEGDPFEFWNVAVTLPQTTNGFSVPELKLLAPTHIASLKEIDTSSSIYFNHTPIGSWKIEIAQNSSIGTRRTERQGNSDVWKNNIKEVILVLKIAIIN